MAAQEPDDQGAESGDTAQPKPGTPTARTSDAAEQTSGDRTPDAAPLPTPGDQATAPEGAGDQAADSGDATEQEPNSRATDPALRHEAAEESRAHSYPPALIATAVALPVVLVVGVLVAAFMASRAPVDREPLVLGPVPAPGAEGPACTELLPALPADLGDYTHAQLVDPQPPGTRAWQRAEGGDPIVLRCGLDRPLDFNRASGLQIVNGVQWFEARDETAKKSTWFAVDRETYVALTVPDGSGPTPLQAVSDAIEAKLPERPIDPGPLPN
ncbi:DUF3515 family protein [Nocardia sp. NPDC048505]|uniref:DUF3515 family protein n=1 Tax=unclassified Nocardia TaxID=2637762 RepID=UPI0033DD1A08